MAIDPEALKTVLDSLTASQERDRSWLLDGLKDWSTDAIFEKLTDLGVDTDANRFHEQAVQANDLKVLEQNWMDQLRPEYVGDRWEDFPRVAVIELWTRLAPDVICASWIEQRLYEALTAEEDGEPFEDVDEKPAELARALDLVNFVNRAPPAERAKGFAEVNRADGYYDYVEILASLIQTYHEDFPAEAEQLADFLIECAVEEDAAQPYVAVSLAMLGRRDEAVQRIQASLLQRPETAWTFLCAGDVYDHLGDVDTAVGFWKRNLGFKPDLETWTDTSDRISDALIAAGRPEEVQAILREYPEPMVDEVGEFAEEIDDDFDEVTFDRQPDDRWDAPDPVAPIKAPAKIGRNDPCPCGSGKKYKKCCLP